jgi:hypothetical protein
MCIADFTVFMRTISLRGGRDDLCDLPLIILLDPGADRSSELLGAHDNFSSRVTMVT